MKQLILSLIVFFTALAVIFFAFAFFQWSLNPKEWGAGIRLAFVLISISFAGITALMFNDLNK